jgi:hypothetical protein
MKWAEILAARQLHITLARLGKERVAIARRDDRIDAMIEVLDPVEIGVHHFDTGYRACADRVRQRGAVHQGDISQSSLNCVNSRLDP